MFASTRRRLKVRSRTPQLDIFGRITQEGSIKRPFLRLSLIAAVILPDARRAMRLMTGFVSLLRRFRADDGGQSLVIISLSMVVMLGMAALAIDVANWYTKHHQAQVVADSAALAAANCLAHPNVGVSGSSCSSSTDVTDARAVAIAYAAANGVTISGSQVVIDTSSYKVTVNASAPTPTMFASVFGVHNTSETATAAASWRQPPPQPCASLGQNCDFMFANSNDSAAGSYALNVAVQGNSTISGNIQTNGNLNASGTGSSSGIYGTGLYGPGAASTTGGNNDPWQTSPPTAEPAATSWPTDYSTDFPACVVGGSGTTACISSSTVQNYPSFCTHAATNLIFTGNGSTGDLPVNGTVYCAIGTGTPSNPSTWNGTIEIEPSGGTTGNTWDATFVGGSIYYSGAGGDTFSACGYTASGFSSSTCSAPAPAATANYPVFYAIDADQTNPCVASIPGSCALSVGSTGNLTMYGDVFAPAGTAALTFGGAQSLGDTFIEANFINASMHGNFSGDGPQTIGPSAPPSGGWDYLSQ
jgi:Flp pilus assembly protein TadG